MRQITREQSQSGFLDPEKVYFVEKFGYLIKNIDNGFGEPVQDALIKRIFKTVDKFKNDLPNVVRDLERNRLKNIGKNKTTDNSYSKPNINNTSTPKAAPIKAVTIAKKEEIIKPVSNLREGTIETEIEIDITPTISKIESKPGSSILRPSTAAIIEENRRKQLKILQEKELERKQQQQQQQSEPLVTRPQAKPNKELTVWERAWHRYGGYTEEIMNGHS